MGLECKISLTKPTPNYFPGEPVQGKIIVINDQPRNVKGLKLKFEGKGSVKFHEMKQQRIHHGHHHGSSFHSHGSSSMNGHSEFETVRVDYSAEEKYLDYTFDIFGNDGCERLIPPGRYEYPFNFTLPYGLPSSYDGAHGKVKYKINAVLPRSWAFNCNTSASFIVTGNLDLNNDPMAQQPVVLKQYKKMGWFFSQGDIGFLFRMPRSGVVLGQIIPFVVEINNKSSKTVTPSVSITQEVKFFAQGKTKFEKRTVCSVEGPVLPPGADEEWIGNSLQVPDLPVSKLGGGCHIIDTSYTLKMKLYAPGLFCDLETETPIVIGNIPFRFGPAIPNDPPPPYQPLDSEDSDFSLVSNYGEVAAPGPVPAEVPPPYFGPPPSVPSAPPLYDFPGYAN